MKLQIVLFVFFFQILRFEIGGAAYLWVQLIYGCGLSMDVAYTRTFTVTLRGDEMYPRKAD